MSEKLAREFHETYERLAPSFGYETRKDTREFDTQSNNGKLMIAVTDEIEKKLMLETSRLKDLVDYLLWIEEDCRDYILELQSDIRDLKESLRWRDATMEPPKTEGEYWVIAQDLDGKLFYATDTWIIDKNYSMWKWYGRHDDETGEPLSDVVWWQEIKPLLDKQ